MFYLHIFKNLSYMFTKPRIIEDPIRILWNKWKASLTPITVTVVTSRAAPPAACRARRAPGSPRSAGRRGWRGRPPAAGPAPRWASSPVSCSSRTEHGGECGGVFGQYTGLHSPTVNLTFDQAGFLLLHVTNCQWFVPSLWGFLHWQHKTCQTIDFKYIPIMKRCG